MKQNVRAHAVISGRVQGVFFRMETQRAAEQYGVFGWVRNKADGTVEAVFEGDRKDVEAVIDWCKKGPPRSKVNRVDVSWKDYKGAFEDFAITF